MVVVLEAGRIQNIYNVVNPDKLAGIPALIDFEAHRSA
jgi:hypothetical protein